MLFILFFFLFEVIASVCVLICLEIREGGEGRGGGGGEGGGGGRGRGGREGNRGRLWESRRCISRCLSLIVFTQAAHCRLLGKTETAPCPDSRMGRLACHVFAISELPSLFHINGTEAGKEPSLVKA